MFGYSDAFECDELLNYGSDLFSTDKISLQCARVYYDDDTAVRVYDVPYKTTPQITGLTSVTIGEVEKLIRNLALIWSIPVHG